MGQFSFWIMCMKGVENMKKHKTRKLTVRVTPQTAFHLERLMRISGQKSPGRVVDKLVRERVLVLQGHTEEI